MSRRDRDRDRDRDRERERERERERQRERERERGRDGDRYARDSESRRRRSGFDREPSPKRSRREENPDTERVHGRSANSDVGGGDEKNRRRVQDALPPEPPSRTAAEAPAPAVESDVARKELSDKKPDGNDRERNHLPDPSQVPRSRSYFQHDERGNAGQVGRSFGRRPVSDRERRDLKDDRNERAPNKSATYDLQRRDEKSQPKVDDNDVWRHDGFLKMEAEPPPPVRKRPAFREKKVPLETEISKKEATGPAMPSQSDRRIPSSERRDERAHNLRNPERSDKPVATGQREAQRGGLPSRDRYGSGGGGGGNYRGRESYNGRQDYHPRGTRGEKWKHDLFDEADKSPNTKNEEDQIAKVEALLAS